MQLWFKLYLIFTIILGEHLERNRTRRRRLRASRFKVLGSDFPVTLEKAPNLW